MGVMAPWSRLRGVIRGKSLISDGCGPKTPRKCPTGLQLGQYSAPRAIMAPQPIQVLFPASIGTIPPFQAPGEQQGGHTAGSDADWQVPHAERGDDSAQSEHFECDDGIQPTQERPASRLGGMLAGQTRGTDAHA